MSLWSKWLLVVVARNSKDVETKKRLLDKMVRKYIKGFGEHVIANGLEVGQSDKPTDQSPWKVVELTDAPRPLAPGPGDCWACHFGISSDDPLKEPMGVEHLLKHMLDEDGPYYVPSLLWKAIVVGGYQNPAFIWQHIAAGAARGDSEYLKRVLTAYFRKRKPAMLELME